MNTKLESLPGAVSIFARAYQQQLSAQGKGGGKSGQAAITELLAAMKKGEVKGDILTYAGDIASQQAQPGLTAAQEASQAQQSRFQNTINDLAVVASNSGVEEGFARIFKTLRQGLEESADLVEALSKGFNTATQAWSELFLIPQDLQRLFDGRDSVIADWLWGKGKAGEETLANMLEIRDLFKNIKELGELSYTGWKQLFDLMSNNQGLQFFGKPLATLNKGFQAVLAAGAGDTESAVDNAKSFGAGYLDTITAIPRGIASFFTTPDADPNAAHLSLNGLVNKTATEGFGSSSWFGSRDTLTEASQDLTRNQMNKAFDDPYYARAGIGDPFGMSAARYDNNINSDAITSQFMQAAASATTNNISNVYNLDINFDVAGTNEGGVDFEAGGKLVADWFKNELGTAAVNFPNNQ